MRIDLFFIFFITFSCYIMLIAIIYMNLENKFKAQVLFLMDFKMLNFEKFQKKVEKSNRLTLVGKWYLQRKFKNLLFDYCYFVKYKNGIQKLNPLFFKIYIRAMNKKIKYFFKLESYEQVILLQTVEKVGLIDGEMQSLLIKALKIKNNFIRFKIMEVIISFKKKGFFLESISFISNHYLILDHQMLIELLEKANDTIPDLEIYDFLRGFDLYEEKLRQIIWIHVAAHNISENKMEDVYKIFENEENAYVRAYFYQFPIFDICKEYPEQFNKDLHSMVDPLRKAVIEYAEINYYKQIKNELINRLPEEKNIDIALSIVKVLQKHADLKLVKLTENSPNFLWNMISYYLMED